MTLSTTTARNDYLGNGSTTVFPYSFRILAATDLVVVERNTTTNVETTLSYPSDYSVSGVGNLTGGSITLSSPLGTGIALAILRVMPLTQPTSIRNQGSYFAETHETVFDRHTMVDQQQQEAIARTFSLPKSVNPAVYTMTLPTPSTGQTLIWGPTGLTNGSIASGNVVLPGAGRTTTTLTEYLANNYVHNVVDYDADPTGATDSTAAIAAAIQAAAAVNGTVYFPIGTFNASNIQATGGTTTTLLHFAGAGPGSVVKLLAGSATCVFFITGIGAVTFDSLTIDGNKANCPSGLLGIRSDVSDTMVRNCKIMNCNEDAIFITPDGTGGIATATRATIVGNHFLNCGNNAYGGVAVAAEQVQGLVVADNVCDSMVGGLCDVEPFGVGAASDSIAITGNTIRNTSGFGIFGAIQVTSDNASNPAGTGQNAVDHVVISGNVVNTTGNGMAGVYIQSSRRTLVAGNYIYGVSSHGVWIDADATRESKYIAVLGNLIVDPSANATSKDGIRLDNAMNCVVANNAVHDTRGTHLMNYAVRETGTSTGNWFGPVYASGALSDIFSTVGTPGTAEQNGPLYLDGLLRLRAQSATRYRTDLSRTALALNIVAYDDTGAVYQPITFNEGNIQLDVGGDINSTVGGFRQGLFGWSQITTVAASQTDVALTDAVAARGRVMPRAGSITAVALNVSTARSAGTLTVKIQKSTDGGATWNTVAGPTAVLNTNVKGSRATFAKDTYAFAAGDMLRMTVTTDGSWAPTANNLDAVMDVEF